MKSLVDQLKSLDVSKLKMKSGRTLEQELQRHAEILKDCIERRLEMDVYNARSPKVYDRTYDLLNSIEVNVTPQLVNVDGKKCLSVKVFFNEQSIHKGLWGESADVATLLNEGYQVSKGWHKNIDYFGRRSGVKFIDHAIEDYQDKVSNPFPVRLTIADEVRDFN